MIEKKPDGEDVIIAGCTEIPRALAQEHLSVPYLDSLTIRPAPPSGLPAEYQLSRTQLAVIG